MLDQAVVSGANFLTAILVARFLGVEEFGRFTLAWLAVLFFFSIQNALVSSPMLSISSKYEAERQPAYFGAVFIHQLIISAVTFVLVLMGAGIAGQAFPAWQIGDLAVPLAAACAVHQLQDFQRRLFYARDRQEAALASDCLRYLGSLVALFWIFSAGHLSTSAALWTLTALAAAGLFAGFPFVGAINLRGGLLAEITKRHWQSARWLAGSNLLVWASGNLFLIAAGTILGSAAVAGLRAAQTLVGVVNLLFQGLENILPPRATARLEAAGGQALTRYLWRVAIWLLVATGGAAIVFGLSPAFWMELVFGAEFTIFAPLVWWFIAIQVATAMVFPMRIGLRTLERTWPVFAGYVVTTLFAAATATPFIEQWGLMGAAVGMLMLQTILLGILWPAFHILVKRPDDAKQKRVNDE